MHYVEEGDISKENLRPKSVNSKGGERMYYLNYTKKEIAVTGSFKEIQGESSFCC